ncbi:MAG: efflux RND transporter periplasmic adaptor subunit [Candidatus Eisenbacteria bacterium]|nr:efflux RND transporter periplasmic adaptor subunit [Candidatus Eisenbacteria bacterium]
MPAKKRTWWILGVVIAAVAALVFVNLRQDRAKRVDVETETVHRRNIKSVVSASGSITPKRKVEVSASQMGTVTRVAVEEGDEVRVGDFLLEIDPVPYSQAVAQLKASVASSQAELELAEAELDRARRDRERTAFLSEQDLASPQKLLEAETGERVAEARRDAARAALRRQEAALRKADHDLGLTTIRAPMSGVVTSLNVEEGETAIVGTMNNPGTVLLVVADLSELEAEVDVDETDVVDLRVGMDAWIAIDSYPDTVFAATVTEIGNSAVRSAQATESVDFLVKVTLRDPVPGAKPGLSATADIIVAVRENVLSVPIQSLTIRRPDSGEKDAGESAEKEGENEEDAVLDDDPTIRRRGDEREGVFLVRDGLAHFTVTETGIAGDRYFEVLSGPEEGDAVVSGDFRAIRDLQDGDPVKVVEKKSDES